MCKKILLACFVLVSFVIMSGSVLAIPNGANFTEIKTEYGSTSHSPEGHSAYGGNVTEMDVDGFTVTAAWQGYFGNVSGTIDLADASGNILYNWSGLATADGEVYVANQSSVTWSGVRCYNLTVGNITDNVTALESYFNINSSDTDGIDETFALNNHAGFTTAGTSFGSGECSNTQLLNNTGGAAFDEVMIKAVTENIPVYVAILSDDTPGFDGETHDFEMMVPEDGHDGDTTPTTYYFYAELDA